MSQDAAKSNWLPRWVHQGVMPLTPPLTPQDQPMLSPQRRNSFSKRVLSDKSFDLVTPDGRATAIERIDRKRMNVQVVIRNISAQFLGWSEPRTSLIFNMKSTLAQLCVDGFMTALELDEVAFSATVQVTLTAITTLGILTLDYVEVGSSIGKLFCTSKHRQVRDIAYITRLLGRVDRMGRPLLFYGRQGESEDWEFQEIDGRVVAFVKLSPGAITYDFEVTGFLPTVGKSLQAAKDMNVKELLRLHQQHNHDATRLTREGQVLMVRSKGMHIRTLYARVVEDLLPSGTRCTSANIVEPHTDSTVEVEQGRTFVFYGNSEQEVACIPLEFFTLEPYREFVYLQDRALLGEVLMDYDLAEKAFATAPSDPAIQSCLYICKSSQLRDLTAEAWVTSKPIRVPFAGPALPELQLKQAQSYLLQQCQYGLLKAISVGEITSQGVLLTKYFVSPILKHLLLSNFVCNTLRALYFQQASQANGVFFSQTDRAMLQDLMTFGVQVFYVDVKGKRLYEYVHRMGTDSGMFVPVGRKEEYLSATYFGVYGSNLIEGCFEDELTNVLGKVRDLGRTSTHPALHNKSLAVVTGGGPGVMELGNRVAHNLGILSCGLFVDFGSASRKPGAVINEQRQNPYVDAFMTYRLEKLVERQSDFNLDFPIFCVGGIGTDFELALEEVRRKVGTTAANPVILFGPVEHWRNKLTPRWLENGRSGVIKGSEWLSNIFYVVQTGDQAFAVYNKFFAGKLAIGSAHPAHPDGFVVVDEAFVKDA